MSDTRADTRERTPLDLEAIRECLGAMTTHRYEMKQLIAEVERLRSLAPGEARPEPDHAAMDLLRRLAAEVGASGWHYEDGVLERCTVGGTADPAQAILLSFDSIDGQAKPRRFDSETNEAIRRLPTMLVTLCEDLQRIRDASREPSQQNDGWRPISEAPRDGWILGYHAGDYDVVEWDGEDNCWRNATCEALYMTHWMPLPPAPRKHEQNEQERAE